MTKLWFLIVNRHLNAGWGFILFFSTAPASIQKFGLINGRHQWQIPNCNTKRKNQKNIEEGIGERNMRKKKKNTNIAYQSHKSPRDGIIWIRDGESSINTLSGQHWITFYNAEKTEKKEKKSTEMLWIKAMVEHFHREKERERKRGGGGWKVELFSYIIGFCIESRSDTNHMVPKNELYSFPWCR